MSYQDRDTAYRPFQLFTAILCAFILSSPATAGDVLSDPVNPEQSSESHHQIGFGLGVLTILGLDISLFFRDSDSPWVMGIHYVNIKDDFINESAAGLPNDSSDKMYTQRAGLFANYLFSPQQANSFYAGGGIYSITKKLKCDSESDSDSSASLYFGGGYQGQWSNSMRYQLGLLLSPFYSSKLSTAICESDESGDFVINVNLVWGFN